MRKSLVLEGMTNLSLNVIRFGIEDYILLSDADKILWRGSAIPLLRNYFQLRLDQQGRFPTVNAQSLRYAPLTKKGTLRTLQNRSISDREIELKPSETYVPAAWMYKAIMERLATVLVTSTPTPDELLVQIRMNGYGLFQGAEWKCEDVLRRVDRNAIMCDRIFDKKTRDWAYYFYQRGNYNPYPYRELPMVRPWLEAA